MQDRICQIDESLLQRTAGPYIGVKSIAFCNRWPRLDFRMQAHAVHFQRVLWIEIVGGASQKHEYASGPHAL
jgi:hypothetical protein